MREHIDRSRDSPGTDAGCGGGGGGDGAGGGGHDEAGDDPDPGKFTDLKLCARENFERGLRLAEYIGSASRDDELGAMMREHARDRAFLRGSGEPLGQAVPEGEAISPQAEWNVVVHGARDLEVSETLFPPGHTPTFKGRRRLALAHYLNVARGYGLGREEVVAIRLWTGPMHRRYSYLLGALCICAGRSRPPGFQEVLYPATLHALNRGIVRLSLLGQSPRVLYRGVQAGGSGAALDGVEPSPVAFTSELDVAKECARRGGTHGLVLELDTEKTGGALAHGADVGWLSQFPGEREVLFPSLSLLRSAAGQPPLCSEWSTWKVSVDPPDVLQELQLQGERALPARTGQEEEGGGFCESGVSAARLEAMQAPAPTEDVTAWLDRCSLKEAP